MRCFAVPSAFLHNELDKDVLMMSKGEVAEMMVRIARKIYRPYVTVNKKLTSMMYVRLRKALYGLLKSSLLFYRNLRKELEDYGFKVNP